MSSTRNFMARQTFGAIAVLVLILGAFAAPSWAQSQTVSTVADLTAALADAAAGTVTEIRIMPGTYNLASPLSVDGPRHLVLQNAGGGRVTLRSLSGDEILRVGFGSPYISLLVSGLTFTGTTNQRAAIDTVARIVVANSTFVGNDLGFYMDQPYAGAEFVNDTFHDNGMGCVGSTSNCGGIWIENGFARATNITVAGNEGFGLKGVHWLVNSIVQGNASGDCFDVPLFRLASIDGGTCHGIVTDPTLSGLADNGGLSQTMALPSTSAAVNAGFTALCPATDQRGALRRDGSCDIGAFEEPSSAAVPAASPYTAVSSVTGLQTAVASAASTPGNHEIRIAAGTYATDRLGLRVASGDTLVLRSAGDGAVVLEGSIGTSGTGNYVLMGLTLSGGQVAGYGDSLAIVDCTVIGGLGFYTDSSQANVAFINDTFTGNLDGIYLDTYGYVTATNVTVSGNSHYGVKGVPFLENSIVHGNGELDCLGIGVVEGSIDGDGSCRGARTIDPHLLGLADNGGPTQTMAITTGSPALDAANGVFCPALDQRGALRNDGACDIGAYEWSRAARIEPRTGGGPIVLSTDSGALTSFRAVDPASLGGVAPSGVTFPFGLLEWKIAGLPTAGATAQVALWLPTAVPMPPQYWQFDPGTGLWTEMCAQLACSVDPAAPNVLHLAFTDGGPGDLDGSADGAISDPGGPGAGGAAAFTLSVDDVPIPEGDSGTTAGTFTVSLSAASSQTVTVQYATADGTATAGSDYVALSGGTLTFSPGETSKTVSVTVNGDTDPEPSETFFVNLSAPVNATIATAQGVGTIVNDDFTLSIDDVTVSEPSLDALGAPATSDATFTVTLSGASSRTVTVDVATADATATVADHDYTPVATTLPFAPGETSKSITVVVQGDTRFENDETFFVVLSHAAGATIKDDRGLGTILNDDQAPVASMNTVSVTEGASGTTPAVFTVTLDHASGLEARVDFATADGTATLADNDYRTNSGTLVFAPGETTKQVTVLVNGDMHVEDDERFFVNLSNPVNVGIRDPYRGGFSRLDGIGYIVSDERMIISVGSAITSEGNSGTAALVFPVTLCALDTSAVPITCGPSDRMASADFATVDGTASAASGDYQPASGTVTFNPGETSKTIVVNVYGDTNVEPDETLLVKLSNGVHAFFTATGEKAVGTIVNDDVASATGAGTVSFSASAGTFASVAAVAEASLPAAGKPPGVTFPFGFFDWTIVGLTGGQAVTVTMTFPAAVPSPPEYWKVIAGLWTDVCQHLACVALGNTLRITFTDGGLGDIDGAVNGQIHDPGGLGIPAQPACHYVSFDLDPATVSQGGLTTVTATVRSCASSAQTVVVRFILTGPLGTSCGQSSTAMFATPPFTLQPGTVKRLSFPVRVPATACPGTYSISATTLTGAVTADTTSASLTVTRR